MQERAGIKLNLGKRRRRGSSLWHDAMRYLFRQRSAILGMVIFGVMVSVAILAPVVATHDPELSPCWTCRRR